MQYDENAEKYGYEGEMTPLKCDELTAYKGDVTIPVYGTIADAKVYLKKEADEAIAELKQKLQDQCISCPVKMQEDDVIAQLKAENERLKRALWLMTAEWAEGMGLASCNIAIKYMSRENFEVGDDYRQKTIQKYRHRQVVFNKYADYCKKKAKEYR